MKKLLSLVVALIAVVAFAKPAKAEAAITANEQAIITALKQPVSVAGQSFSMPQEYITQAENHLKANDLTQAEINSVVSDINGAKAILANAQIDTSKLTAGDLDSLIKSMSADDIAAIKNLVSSAASTLGLKITSWGNGRVQFASKSGATALSTDPAVKQTGANYLVSLVVLVSLLAGATGAFVVGNKARIA